MSKLRSVSRPVLSGTISVDASYAQELVEFWTQKYERVKEELNQVKVRVPQCNSEDCWCISLTVAATFTRTLPLPLPHHLRQALTTKTTRRGKADPAPPRSSESRITLFPTPKVTHPPV